MEVESVTMRCRRSTELTRSPVALKPAWFTSWEIYDLLPTDIALPVNHAGFKATGLRVNSVLRLHRMVTLSTSIIQRELGRLSPPLELEVRGKLSLLFAPKHQ